MFRNTAIAAFLLLLFAGIIIFGNASSREYKVDGIEYEPFFIDGVKGDEHYIMLNFSTSPVELVIMNYSNYYDWIYFKGHFNTEIVWEQTGVTEGVWMWRVPNNEDWVLVLSYPEDLNVDYDLKVINASEITQEDELRIISTELRIALNELNDTKNELYSLSYELESITSEMENTSIELVSSQNELRDMKIEMDKINNESNGEKDASKKASGFKLSTFIMGLIIGIITIVIIAICGTYVAFRQEKISITSFSTKKTSVEKEARVKP